MHPLKCTAFCSPERFVCGSTGGGSRVAHLNPSWAWSELGAVWCQERSGWWPSCRPAPGCCWRQGRGCRHPGRQSSLLRLPAPPSETSEQLLMDQKRDYIHSAPHWDDAREGSGKRSDADVRGLLCKPTPSAHVFGR